jgi:hypothetical protein
MRKADFKSQISEWRSRHVATISLVACSALLFSMSPASFGVQQNPAKPPADGTFLAGVDGKLMAGDTWLFELVADADSVNGPVSAGTQFELLPCATLELLIADVKDRYAPTYRLSARVTRFRGKSFLFPTYYLPLSKLKGAESPDAPNKGSQALREPARSGGPDPDLAIPQEVVEKLKDRRMVRGPQRESGKPGFQKGPDHTLVDAIGRIEPAAGPVASSLQPPASADRFVFVPDAFGWNVSGTRYELLPCGVLEQALQRQAASPEPIRFSVAGLVTEFKGKKYLLLQRVIRAYGHGNFVK